MKIYKTVNDYIASNKQWGDALKKLRSVIIKTELNETAKWGVPVYTINDKNIVGIGAFKSYVGLWFFQGALLKDSKQRLVNAQEGITKAQRQMRFNSTKEIDEKVILEYLKEAIKNQKAGKEINPVKKPKLTIPTELNEAFNKNVKLKKRFKELTPFIQREYCEYIYEAKREATKSSRLEKILPIILKGIGLNDKYR
ncbi:MAG: DUF1801 domain-containing protein [Ignavibacteria bacterium]|nr:DUF1801 domain-containing protein [Ignavibacteria bacterium]